MNKCEVHTIHRMVTWDNDPVGRWGDIVCGLTKAAGTQTSTLPSGYTCDDCHRLTPTRQLAAQTKGILDDVREHGPQTAVSALMSAYAALAGAVTEGMGVAVDEWHYEHDPPEDCIRGDCCGCCAEGGDCGCECAGCDRVREAA